METPAVQQMLAILRSEDFRAAVNQLPGYRAIRKRHDLFDVCRRPELCAQVTTMPVDTGYGMREGSHVDPDGNLLRFGSPLASSHEH